MIELYRQKVRERERKTNTAAKSKSVGAHTCSQNYTVSHPEYSNDGTY